jgi:predicted lipoprotein with Yx(FWY)xxD motif
LALGVAARGGGSARDAHPARAVVKAAFNTTLKTSILVDVRGRTLYVFLADAPDTSTCTDDPTYHCTRDWPPLTTRAAPQAGKGVRPSLLGTIKRTDGRIQVTYKHQPLYLFLGYHRHPGHNCCAETRPDRKPGDVYGQAWIAYWFVVSPNGNPIYTRLPNAK